MGRAPSTNTLSVVESGPSMSKSSGNPAEDYSRGELAIAQGLFNNPLNDITCIRTVRPILNFFLFPESLERALSDDMFSSIF